MAQIVGFLGPPPREFIRRSETTSQCFDVDGELVTSTTAAYAEIINPSRSGHWKAGEHARIPTTSLEEVETRLEGRDKDLFLQFIRSMLKWLPEERKTAKELLEDPWLNVE
jgi:serine/threonine protein kinase